VWAPSKVSAPFGYRPYWVQHTDPATGEVSRIIAVPGARYEGVEDGRGGFGALDYQQVMSQYASANTNSSRPMLVVLAHDGDNCMWAFILPSLCPFCLASHIPLLLSFNRKTDGGGTDSYYHSNFNNFVSWAQGVKGQFECTTIEDYLVRL
jgi:hypothetical protein